MHNTDDADEHEETVSVNGNEGEEQQGTDNE
jgi:coatomer subunit beta'